MGKSQEKPWIANLPLYLGLLAVLALLILVLREHLFPSAVRVYEPHYLLPVFNTSLFLAASVVAYIARRIYLLSGSSTILWIGCGVLTLGLASVTAGWLIRPFGPNVNVTIFNVGALLSALCHMAAVMANLSARSGEADLNRRKQKVWLAYLAVSLGIALLVALTVGGLMPPFFMQGQGPTILRQNVAAWAIILFLVASGFTLSRFLRQKASFLYWYSLALALVALSMLAFLLQPAVGSPIGWLGRSSYVLAAVYFLISVRSGLQEARTPGANPRRVMSELFGPGLHWQEILATVSDAVISYDDKGEILLWNQAAEIIFGYPEAGVIGRSIDPVLPDLQAIKPGGGITEMELARPDGTRFSAEVSASKVGAALGELTTLVIRDVTARKRGEKALRVSEEHYRSLFEHMLNGFAYCQMHYEQNRPVDFTYLTVNRAFETLTGLKDVTGKKISEVIPGIRESNPELLEIYGRVALTGMPERFETYLDPLKMWLSISVYCPRKECFVAVFDVITARKQAEEETQRLLNAVQLEKDKLTALINSINDEVWFADTQKKFTLANPSALREFGLDHAGEIGVEKLAENLEIYRVDGSLRPIEETPPLRALQGEVVRNHEEIIRTPGTGELRYRQVNSAPVRDANGDIIGSVSVVQDITARKQAEEALRRLNEDLEERVKVRTGELQETVAQLEEEMSERQQAESELARLNEELEQRVKERTAALEFANQELESFSYSVSHDLKAPIRAIQGFSRMLADDHAARLDQEGSRLLRIVIDNTRIMAKLIDDLLALSRVGRHEIKKSSVDLAALVRKDFALLRQQEPERDLQLSVQDLPRGWGDPSLLNQVLMNLLENALKYTRGQKSGNIEVGGRRSGPETIYYVKDNGVGFDPQYAHKLFGVFQRLHSGAKYEGTGVGLAIVQRIIQRHGGRVWAEGQVNAGAAFYFALPGNGD